MNHRMGPARNCSRVQFIPNAHSATLGVLPHAEGWQGDRIWSPAGTAVTLAPAFPVKTTCATVLFADMRGYTGLAERLPAARVVTLLDEFYGVLASATEAYDGEVFHMAGEIARATGKKNGDTRGGYRQRSCPPL
jgi:hypothetical protein